MFFHLGNWFLTSSQLLKGNKSYWTIKSKISFLGFPSPPFPMNNTTKECIRKSQHLRGWEMNDVITARNKHGLLEFFRRVTPPCQHVQAAAKSA